MTRARPIADDPGAVDLGTTRPAYRLLRSDRRTLEIAVTPAGVIEVRAPRDLAREQIEKRLRARGKWIRRRLSEHDLARPEAVPRTYRPGETHRYLGRQYRLVLERGSRAKVGLLSGRIRITTTDPANPRLVRLRLERWYLLRAKSVLSERLQRLLALPALQRVRPSAIRIQRMTTRWGSCSHSGRILLNTDLIRLPVSLIDYVIAHELCHLRVREHGTRFELYLARVMPDWLERSRRLAAVRLD